MNWRTRFRICRMSYGTRVTRWRAITRSCGSCRCVDYTVVPLLSNVRKKGRSSIWGQLGRASRRPDRPMYVSVWTPPPPPTPPHPSPAKTAFCSNFASFVWQFEKYAELAFPATRPWPFTLTEQANGTYRGMRNKNWVYLVSKHSQWNLVRSLVPFRQLKLNKISFFRPTGTFYWINSMSIFEKFATEHTCLCCRQITPPPSCLSLPLFSLQ